MENKDLLETLLVAQVLTLAKTMEAAGNMSKTDHYVGDALNEILGSALPSFKIASPRSSTVTASSQNKARCSTCRMTGAGTPSNDSSNRSPFRLAASSLSDGVS